MDSSRDIICPPGDRHATPMRCMHIMVSACILLVCVFVWMFSRFTIDNQPASPKSHVIAYYQTSGKHALAIQVVLSLFHRVYPWARICMYLDTLDTNIKLVPLGKGDLITITTRTTEESASKTGMYFDTVHAAQAYIQRLQATAGLMPGGWILLLEDDVWVWRAVPEPDLLYDISGACRAIYRPEYAAIIRNQTTSPLCYGGFGGQFVNSSRLLGLSQARVSQLIKRMLAVYSPIASDELLSAVVLNDGGTIGYYTGYYETLRTNDVVKTEHQMKWLYGW